MTKMRPCPDDAEKECAGRRPQLEQRMRERIRRLPTAHHPASGHNWVRSVTGADRNRGSVRVPLRDVAFAFIQSLCHGWPARLRRMSSCSLVLRRRPLDLRSRDQLTVQAPQTRTVVSDRLGDLLRDGRLDAGHCVRRAARTDKRDATGWPRGLVFVPMEHLNIAHHPAAGIRTLPFGTAPSARARTYLGSRAHERRTDGPV